MFVQENLQRDIYHVHGSGAIIFVKSSILGADYMEISNSGWNFNSLSRDEISSSMLSEWWMSHQNNGEKEI